ncbi:MAG TPA: GDCCVxC domain-containing (seleno)protein [Gemmatimonadaceae bacterium]|nr:GDCCVxC domain-containing (seleno)protein [Gemmatimonadaceae bacterium]
MAFIPFRHNAKASRTTSGAWCTASSTRASKCRLPRATFPRMDDLRTASTLTCPNCGAKTHDSMPVDACVYLWSCPVCKATVSPKQGDCCVFCSYGTVPCPPVQRRQC